MAGERSILKSIQPHEKDLGGFSVKRSIPQVGTKSIGPWVFFDHFGPAEFPPGEGINVRPHPHINLATVSYLFEGEIYHRDSLGSDILIHPGAINLMVAGKGITHSERTREELRSKGYRLHGLQLWHALPEGDEEMPPAFFHTAAQDIPEKSIDGVKVRVMMGTAYNLTSPVKTFSSILYLEADMPAGSDLSLPSANELGVYVVKGQALIDGEESPLFTMSVLSSNAKRISAIKDTRLAIIGGAPLGKRYLDWNFVSSRKERIEQAKQDWKAGRFPKVPGDTEEYIPLPEQTNPTTPRKTNL
jgi:redox-sensitive bicupin YhaK (pirin superfamily)